MKRTRAIAIAVLGVASTFGQSPAGGARNRRADAAFIYADDLPRILRESRVPPKLPTQFADVNQQNPIFVTVISVTAKGYELTLGMEPGCEGGNACRYGSVYGSSLRIHDLGDGKWQPITLARGIHGEYLPTKCHAVCTDAYVRWKQQGFWYAVGVKAGSKREVVRAANSAIRFNPQSERPAE